MVKVEVIATILLNMASHSVSQMMFLKKFLVKGTHFHFISLKTTLLLKLQVRLLMAEIPIQKELLRMT